MEPLVSIDCITYNHAQYIKDALDGFLAQKTDFPFEICIHDDASTDGTQDILREYEKNYPKLFKILYQKENLYGKTGSFEEIVKIHSSRLRGKYIATCEGDDYWFAPDKLQMQVDYLEKHPDCVLSCHPVVWLNSAKGGRAAGVDQLRMGETDIYADLVILPGKFSIPTCSRVFRRDIAKDIPKFRRIAHIGDYPLICHLITKGYFHYFPHIMGAYRAGSAGSWNDRFNNDRDFAINHHIDTFKWLYEFDIYAKGEYSVYIGKNMWNHVLKLDELNAVAEYPWLSNIVVEALEKSKTMTALENLLNETSDENIKEKHKAAQYEYWSWFVKKIGEGANAQNF